MISEDLVSCIREFEDGFMKTEAFIRFRMRLNDRFGGSHLRRPSPETRDHFHPFPLVWLTSYNPPITASLRSNLLLHVWSRYGKGLSDLKCGEMPSNTSIMQFYLCIIGVSIEEVFLVYGYSFLFLKPRTDV